MTTVGTNVELDAYFAGLAAHLPVFTLEEQRTALTIYRELAKGDAVEDSQLAAALGVTLAEARARRESPAVKSFVFPDREGRILGFGGLAAAPMHHEFVVKDRTLWTWCAWDTLFIPELLGESARVSSPDPRTQNPVRLVVSSDGVHEVDPDGAVVSFVRGDAEMFTKSAENVMASFCHHVFFFESRASGEAWAADRPDTILFSVAEAFALAERLNARNFGEALAERR